MGTLATNVSIFRAFEGPQLVLAWTNCDDVGLTRVQVRRGISNFPQDETEGNQVYLDNAPVISGDVKFPDLTVVGQDTYYYTIFMEVLGTWYSGPTTQAKEIAFDNSDFHQRLWKALPEIYRRKDLETAQYPLQQTQDADGAWWNYNEDQSISHGQLYRFLKMYGLILGYARELTLYYEKFYDVYDVSSDHLTLIADYLALQLVSGIGLDRQRFVIANAVPIYKIRGTVDGVQQFADGNFQTEPMIVEINPLMIESNTLDRTSVSSDPLVLADYGTPWDTIDHCVSGEYWARWTYRTLVLFFDTCLDSDITQAMIDSAEQYLSDFIPGTAFWYAYTHWDSMEFEDDFPDFANWTKGGAGGAFLTPSGGFAYYNKTAPIAASIANLRRNGEPFPIQSEFAVEVDFQDVVLPPQPAATAIWVTTVAFNLVPSYYMSVEFNYVALTDTLSLIVRKSDSSGLAIIANVNLDSSVMANGGIVRIERGSVAGHMRVIVSTDGDKTRELVASHISADFAGANIARCIMVWQCDSGEFQIKHDKYSVYQSNIGWRQRFP